MRSLCQPPRAGAGGRQTSPGSSGQQTGHVIHGLSSSHLRRWFWAPLACEDSGVDGSVSCWQCPGSTGQVNGGDCPLWRGSGSGKVGFSVVGPWLCFVPRGPSPSLGWQPSCWWRATQNLANKHILFPPNLCQFLVFNQELDRYILNCLFSSHGAGFWCLIIPAWAPLGFGCISEGMRSLGWIIAIHVAVRNYFFSFLTG